MHIVILDGGSTNPGDVSWAPLRALGSVTVYDSTKPEEIVERAKDAEAVILNRNVISREIMQKLPKLRFIGLLATGYNTVDVKAAGELGITVCNVPLYCVETVAQQAFALLLELCNLTEKISAATRLRTYRADRRKAWRGARHENSRIQPHETGTARALSVGGARRAFQKCRCRLAALPAHGRDPRACECGAP